MKKTALMTIALVLSATNAFAGGYQIAHCVGLDGDKVTTTMIDLYQGMPDQNQKSDYFVVYSDSAKLTLGEGSLLGPVNAPMVLGNTDTNFKIVGGSQKDFDIEVNKGKGTKGRIRAGAGAFDLKCDADW